MFTRVHFYHWPLLSTLFYAHFCTLRIHFWLLLHDVTFDIYLWRHLCSLMTTITHFTKVSLLVTVCVTTYNSLLLTSYTFTLYHLCFGHFLHTKTHLFSLMFTFGSLLGEVTYAHFSTLMHVARHRRRARRWPWAVWRRSWAFWRPKLHFQALKIEIAFLFLLCKGYFRPLCASFGWWKWSCEAKIKYWNRST